MADIRAVWDTPRQRQLRQQWRELMDGHDDVNEIQDELEQLLDEMRREERRAKREIRKAEES